MTASAIFKEVISQKLSPLVLTGNIEMIMQKFTVFLNNSYKECEYLILDGLTSKNVQDIKELLVLQTNDLNTENDSWAIRLRYAYADALDAAGRSVEARKWFKKCADIDVNESTDAIERCE